MNITCILFVVAVALFLISITCISVTLVVCREYNKLKNQINIYEQMADSNYNTLLE